MLSTLLRSNGARAAKVGVAITVTLAGLVITGCGLPVMAQDKQDLDPAPGSTTYSYSGAQQQSYTVPGGVTSVTITASGGSGGNVKEGSSNQTSAPGAQVTGTVSVQPGQVLLIDVAGDGESATSSDHDPQGGWGGLGAKGGNGNAASDDLRTGAAGGGATTIQLTDTNGDNPQTILVAGGGGGAGGPSGDPDQLALGGGAGCTGGDNQTPSWQGSGGQNGSPIKDGGKGGSAGGESGMAGGRGKGGSGLGGNGGGGGGGVNGGDPGSGASGTSAAGGGGAGTSATYTMTNTSITCAANSEGFGVGDGQAVIVPSSSS